MSILDDNKKGKGKLILNIGTEQILFKIRQFSKILLFNYNQDSQKIFITKESVITSNTVLLQYRGRKKEICEDQNLSLTS